jgi:hypothetical protein
MQNVQRLGAAKLAAVFLAMFAVLAGCEDECKKGKTECINSELIRTCVPTADDPEWLITECPEHSVCVDDGASAGGDAGADTASGAMCVGKCDLGEHECVSDALARVCIEGGIWQLDACEVGEKCTDGVCLVGGGPGGVQACVPDTRQCASDMVEKICDPDGTAWIQQPCAFNEHCVGTECVPDTTASCDDGNVCLDAKTAVRCLGQDDGFELVPCAGDTYCEFGRCRGPVCAIGSVCSGPVSPLLGVASQVRTCVGGVGFEDEQCGVNEVCKQDKDNASCVPNICVPGVTQCGDPRDPAVDPTKFFTTCVGGGVTASLVPEWVQGECAGELICDPTMIAGGTPCRRTCTPGAQQCAVDAALGTSSGVQTCSPEGTWLAAETCHTAPDPLKTCMISPNPDASVLPAAVCGEPVCARVFSALGVAAGFEGTCDEDGKLHRCNPDGTLGEAEDCLQGVCANGAFEVAQGDGRTAGACQITPQCQEGDERCVWAAGGFTPTPQFQGCVNGFWSTHLQACPSDGLCYPTKTAANRPAKVCGAECSPGGHSCIPDPDNLGEMLLTTCGANGQYDAGQACPAGTCTPLTTYDAACVMQCIPGTLTCAGGLPATAPDGIHAGTDASATCQDDGTFGPVTPCTAGTVCRTSSTGVVLGCVECIGPGVAGGNAQGVNDSTCDPASAGTILECDANNELTPRACEGTKVCTGATPSTCGTCSDGIGITPVTCTDTNLVAAQVCGGCTIDTDGINGAATAVLSSCTEAAMAATVVAGGLPTCADQSQGTAIPWAGVTDCCSFVANGFAGCTDGGYGLPTPVSGAADCCTNTVIAGGGGTFAYCVEPAP